MHNNPKGVVACTEETIDRLAKFFKDGKKQTDSVELFDGIDIEYEMMANICQHLENQNAIKCVWVPYQKPPYMIQILPNIIHLDR